MHAFSARYDAALALAAVAHRAQLRKGSDVPYIAHAVAVSLILLRHGYGEDLCIAGLLHDVVEDTDVSAEAIAAQFGDDVARLVAAVSETKRADGIELPWEERKREGLAHLALGGADVAALKAADAIHNARTTSIDLNVHGPSVWERFKRGPAETTWYYRQILGIVNTRIPGTPITAELADAVAELALVAG